MVSGTLERCSLHGWIPVFTVQGRWQMADSVYGIVWVSGLLMSTLWIEWWQWDYGMGRRMLWTTNTGAFYWWHFECTEIPWRDPEAHCCAIHSTTINSGCSMIMHGRLQGSVHNSWKLKTSKSLHGQHTHRTCHPLSMFGMLWIGVYNSVFSSCQYPATSHSCWRGVDQHSTGHNKQPYQLYAKEMCCTAWDKWWSHQILTGFRTPPIQ